MTPERRPTAKGRPDVTRPTGYHWKLSALMEEQGMKASVELGPLLARRGVILSDAQVYRLIHYTPERLSLRTLSALCDIFVCTPNDLVVPFVEGVSQLRTAAGGAAPKGKTGPAKSPVSDLPEGFAPEKADLGPSRKRP
ncbi:DNA-binding Xre family transcriptional regulator [Arthrobacter sp. GAS37]|uniref:helix-turn-helix domain-containing protein n=1 Tax=Arthrobacter sp. GAS37 TaxID=3156261 RepID=UPI003832590E